MNNKFTYSQYRGFAIRNEIWGDTFVIDEALGDTYGLSILDPRHTSGNQIVVDVGAHIGTFARSYLDKNPAAIVTCVEAVEDNIDALTRNTLGLARILHAACTYEDDACLLNSVFAGGQFSGGSIVRSRSEVSNEQVNPQQYFVEQRNVPALTLEQILDVIGEDHIDVLKLDCEGSEMSILGECQCLDKIGFICGEYHDLSRWEPLQRRRFSDWEYSIQSGGNVGIFHLRNPNWEGCWNEQQ